MSHPTSLWMRFLTGDDIQNMKALDFQLDFQLDFLQHELNIRFDVCRC